MRWLFLAPLLAFFFCAPAQASSYLGSHAILYADTPYGAKQEMFSQAKASGASTIRVDVYLPDVFRSGYFRGRPFSTENWDSLDQFQELSRRYNLKLLMVLYGSPAAISSCAAEEAVRCPPVDSSAWGAYAGKVATRYRSEIEAVEIYNEPDLPRYFSGTPTQYAELASAAADSVHGAGVKVMAGGISQIDSTSFLDQVFSARPDLAAKLDIAAIHLRSSALGVPRWISFWRAYFDRQGVRGPLWLTEFGYPSLASDQWASGYQSGEESQAAFYKDTMPWALSAGADRIFPTLRDWGSGGFKSEGLLESPDPLPASFSPRRRPAFSVISEYSTSLAPSYPPAPRGSIVLSPRQGRTLKARSGKISLAFQCPQPGRCPAQSFRLKLRSGGSYLVRNPEGIAARSTRTARITLTPITRKRLSRAGRLAGVVSDLHGKALLSVALKK